MSDKTTLNPRTEVCTHCEGYAAEFAPGQQPKQEGGKPSTAREGEFLCGNCNLLTPAKRDVDKRFAARVVSSRKAADQAAKDAYLAEIRKLNSDEVAEVTGDDDKKSRTESAK